MLFVCTLFCSSYLIMLVGMDSPADPQRKGKRPKSLASKPLNAPGSRKSTGPGFQLLCGQTSLKPPANHSGNHSSIQQDKPETSETQNSGSDNVDKSIPTVSVPAATHEKDEQRELEEVKVVKPAPPRLAWKTMVRSAPAPPALKVTCCLLGLLTFSVGYSWLCTQSDQWENYGNA